MTGGSPVAYDFKLWEEAVARGCCTVPCKDAIFLVLASAYFCRHSAPLKWWPEMVWGQDYSVSFDFLVIKILRVPILKGICVFYLANSVHIYMQSLAIACAVCSKVKCSRG